MTTLRLAGRDTILVGQDTPWGVATTFCEVRAPGLWACATHGVERFEDRAALAVHVDDTTDGGHLIVWRCTPCGEPHGWRQ